MRAPRRSTMPCSAKTSKRREGPTRWANLRDFVAECWKPMARRSSWWNPMDSRCWLREPLRGAMDWPELVRLGFGAVASAGLDSDRPGGRLARPLRRPAWRTWPLGRAAVHAAGGSGRRAIRSACSTMRSTCPMPSGASVGGGYLDHAACCWPFVTLRYPMKNAKGWSGSLQPRHRRRHRRDSSHGCARSCWRRSGMAGCRNRNAPCSGAGLGCGGVAIAGLARSLTIASARSGAVPAGHAPALERDRNRVHAYHRRTASDSAQAPGGACRCRGEKAEADRSARHFG